MGRGKHEVGREERRWREARKKGRKGRMAERKTGKKRNKKKWKLR